MPTSPTGAVLVLAPSLSLTLEELSTSMSSSPPEKENKPPVRVRENQWVKLLTLTIIEEVRVNTIMNELSDDLVGNEGRGSDDSGDLDSGVKLRDVGTWIFSVLSAN